MTEKDLTQRTIVPKLGDKAIAEAHCPVLLLLPCAFVCFVRCTVQYTQSEVNCHGCVYQIVVVF